MTATWSQQDAYNRYIRLEIAFGADLTSDPTTWVWTDMSVRLKGQAKIVRGRADLSSTTQPSKCSLVLENTDGWLTPSHPLSPWYGTWMLGTPMRLSVINMRTGDKFILCQGGASEIDPQWPGDSETYAVVAVDFQGVLQRLGQGKDIRSAMYRIISAGKPTRYWPCEDGKGAISLAEYSGGPPMTILGGASVGQGSPTSGASAPLLTTTALTSLTAPVKMPAGITGWTVEWFMNLGGPGVLAANPIMQWTTSGTIRMWRLTTFVQSGIDNIGIEGFDSSTNKLIDFETPFSISGSEAYGQDFYVCVCARQNGGNLEFEFVGYTYNGLSFAKSVGGSITGTLGALNHISTPFQGPAGWVLGHISVWPKVNDSPSFLSKNFPNATSLNGQSGDPADTRISNMAALANVAYRKRTPGPVDASSSLMGVIGIATPLAVMREAEDADMGILTDGLNSGVDYLPRSRRYNLPVALALNTKSAQVKKPFLPMHSNQVLRNTEVISRNGGSSGTIADAVSVQTQGVYPEQKTLNLASDAELLDQAGFRLNVNAFFAHIRVPSVTVDLNDRPELIQPWLDNCDVGVRFTVDGLFKQFTPGTLDQVIEQYTMTIDKATWRLEIVGSPYQPWNVFIVEDTLQGRADTSGSKLGSGVSALTFNTVDTWSIVTADGPIWTTSAGDFPFDVNCEGERVTVTNITGASSPQTATVKRAINGVVKAHPANALLSLWQPAFIGF